MLKDHPLVRLLLLLPLFSYLHLSHAFLHLPFKAGGRRKKKGELVLCKLGLSLSSAKRTQTQDSGPLEAPDSPYLFALFYKSKKDKRVLI